MSEAVAKSRLRAAPAEHPLRSRIDGPRRAGRLQPLDPRLAAWRPDLADIALASKVSVPHYVAPVEMRMMLPAAPLQPSPDANAPMASEMLHGESFALLDVQHGWAWGYSRHDHYVGYVPVSALAPQPSAIGHEDRIGPGDGLLFRTPSIKAEVMGVLPAGAVVRWRDEDEAFVRLIDGPFADCLLHRRHLASDRMDWVENALAFVGAPYRWGGRTRAGIDCSGLVQAARVIAGIATRRDSDMQAADTPRSIPAAAARRGDLAFWPGHVGILLDGETLLHANAHWMRCVVEPLSDVEARAGRQADIRRP